MTTNLSKHFFLRTFGVIFGLLLAFVVFATNTEAASLSFSPDSADVKAGNDLVVKIILDADAGQLIDGADAIVKYDPNKLKTKEIKAGTAFANIVTKERKGRLQLSGLASTKGTLFTVPDTLATVSFEVLESGKTGLSFDFTEGSTVDSNVVLHGELRDVLVSVSSGQYTVQATSKNQFFSMFRRLLPVFFIIFIFLVVAVGVIWYLKTRKKPEGDVFYPSPVPLDQTPPDIEIGEGSSGEARPSLANESPKDTQIPIIKTPPAQMPPVSEGS